MEKPFGDFASNAFQSICFFNIYKSTVRGVESETLFNTFVYTCLQSCFSIYFQVLPWRPASLLHSPPTALGYSNDSAHGHGGHLLTATIVSHIVYLVVTLIIPSFNVVPFSLTELRLRHFCTLHFADRQISLGNFFRRPL